MAHANKTYVSSGGTVGINSILPNGGVPVIASGIQVIGTVAHGNIITVNSGNDIDFGDIAPDFMFSWALENATAGADLTLTKGVTYKAGYVASNGLTYTTATKMPVHTVTGMPYNKALPFGSLKDFATEELDNTPINPKAQIISRKKYTSFFNSSYVIWPAANQVNQLALQGEGEQVKFYGNQFQDGFSLGTPIKVDVYHGPFGANYNGTMKANQSNGTSNSGSFAGSQTSDLGAGWSGGYCYFPTVTNNAGAVVSSGITYPANTNMNIYVDSTHQRSSILTYQTFIVSGAVDIVAQTKVIDSSLGVICDLNDGGARNPSCLNTMFDRFDYPKNVQGMNVPDNKHFYAAGMIQLVSVEEGVASCRCEIANTATPVKELTKSSVCIPLYWSSHLLRIQIIEGTFWNQSLSGMWLHFYGAFDEFLGAWQIS
jgi:hypothetical protein